MRLRLKDPANRLDDRLRSEVGEDVAPLIAVHAKRLPGYRYVDLYRAVEATAAPLPRVRSIDAYSPETLLGLLHAAEQEWASRQIVRAERRAFQVDADDEVFLPVDAFWIAGDIEADVELLLRIGYDPNSDSVLLEVGSRIPDRAERIVARIIKASEATSIYRGRMIAIGYESGTRDEYGEMERPERLQVTFKTARPVDADDFVVDDEVFATLRRNIIDLHQRRDVLKAKGVPIRRGVLLYGPPGTGKTFACRYVCGALPDTTRLLVAGTALQSINKIFELARLYQPSIVILEDVDLVFASRDINLYSSALGDLLDQMDGLRPFEDVSVVLTTNSIERMEGAIKDRPGRISQVIHFGAPAADLRRRYVDHYLRDYDRSAIDMDDLVELSSGTTPAFLKEWVHRAVQFATERLADAEEAVEVTTADFADAMDEMRRFSEGSTGRIVGFLGPDGR